METVKRNRPAADLAQSLRQTESAFRRSQSIEPFSKALRKASLFQPTWDAVGGAQGLADVMSGFSLRDVRAMCRHLGRTAGAPGAAAERRAALSELLRTLLDGTYDVRPLRGHYQRIVPACTYEAAEAFGEKRDVKWTSGQRKFLILRHRAEFENKFLKDLVSPEAPSFRKNLILFQGNLDYCETVVTTVATHDGHVSHDFMDDFAMPLLKRLGKRQSLKETKSKFLSLVIDCITKHPECFKSFLHFRPRGLIHDHLLLHYRPGNALVEQHLGRLLPLVDESHHRNLRQVYDVAMVPANTYAKQRARSKQPGALPTYDVYPLFRFLLRHLTLYRVDIADDSDDSNERLQRGTLQNPSWPFELFTSMEPATALSLLERLDRLGPKDGFYETSSAPRTIYHHKSKLRGSHGDVELLRTSLQARIQGGGGGSCSDRTRHMIEKRRYQATKAREQDQRAFWALSALYLSVASGDLEVFEETIVWARRFVKDAQTSRVLHVIDGQGILTAEVDSLLSCVPAPHEQAVPRAAHLVRKDMATANRITVELARTYAAAASEPGFRAYEWDSVLNVSHVMATLRLNGARVLENIFGTTSELSEAVWKPTITSFFDMDDQHSASSGKSGGIRDPASTRACALLTRLGGAAPKTLADLAPFTVETLEARGLWSTGHLVSIMMLLARSDQPALACPYIRDAVAHSGVNDSSWHRQLVTTAFLSSLPAAVAREFLYSIAGGIADSMRAQNSRPRPSETAAPADAASTPHVKVTTIKMMAQTLQGNVYLDALSSANLLISLLDEARHIDARIAIVNSLVGILEEPTCSPAIRQRVLEALEASVVPVAARVNERRPVDDDEWESVPEVGDDTAFLSMLIEKAGNPKLSEDDRAHFTRILTAILELSAENNERWMRAFLAKNKFAVDRLPPSPVSPAVLASILEKYYQFLPQSFVGLMKSVVLANLNPPADVARITKTVSADRDFESSNAGRHWLNVFGDARDRAFGLGLSAAVTVLLHTDEPACRHVEESDLRDLIVEAAESMISQGQVDLLERLVGNLTGNRTRGGKHLDVWTQKGVPIIEKMISLAEAWRNAPGRPPVLPNTFRLQTKLLPVPLSDTGDQSSTKALDEFVDRLRAHVDDLARRVPYHTDLKQLQDDLVCIQAKDSGYVAVKLAAMDEVATVQEPPLAAYLRLELVASLLPRATDPGQEVARAVQEMVGAWKTCAAEGLRVMGQQAEKAINQQDVRERRGYT